MSSTSMEPSPSRGRSSRARLPGFIALGLLAYWVAALVILHIIRPDMDPLARAMSEYVVGPYGWIMTTTFFALAISIVAVALGLQSSLSVSRGKQIGLVLLYVSSAGIAVAGVFPGLIGPPQPPPPYDLATMAAYIEEAGPMHDIGGMVAFLALAVALPVVSNRFSQDKFWSPIAEISRGLAYLYIGGLVALFIVAGVVGPGLLGLAQRIFMAAMIAWMIIVARRLGQTQRVA